MTIESLHNPSTYSDICRRCSKRDAPMLAKTKTYIYLFPSNRSGKKIYTINSNLTRTTSVHCCNAGNVDITTIIPD